MPESWHLIEAGVATAAHFAGMTDAPEALFAAVGPLASPAKHVRVPFVPREQWLRAARESCIGLAEAVRMALAAEARPLILGGECSVVAGSMPGLYPRLDDVVLVYIDAHGDFNTLATTPSHFVGGMCLAHVCGRHIGPLLWAGVRAFPERQVCLVGARELDPGERGNLERSNVHRFAFDDRVNETPAALAALRRKRVFVHLDLDVVDPAEMFAVNFPVPRGVSFEALGELMRGIAGVATIVGLEVCAYDPRKDPKRELPSRIAAALAPLLRVAVPE
ncbi:MAG TPA: arginase family protein [Candidatus Dormibacteraeota bacterium]|nr:arginase family protein [Candidatus Dormibacteraeota bacterium]